MDGMVLLRLLTVDVDARGRGVGQAALSALCGRADEHRWTVRLAATGDLGSDVRRLVHWYARHGFVPDPAGHMVWPNHVPMVRRPHISTP
jgi:GNAT superfamily N-acetyltransferase